jgi:copper transport protein
MATTPSLPKTDRSRLARALLVAIVAASVWSAVLPLPARGHALLLDADPTPNSVIPRSPPAIALFFSEAVDAASISLRIVDSAGRPVIGVGAPRLDGTGLVVRADLPELAPDTYTVEYGVVSAVDGHPTVSLYGFVVDPTGAAPPPNLPVPGATAPPPDPVAVAARWLATIAALVLVGTVIVWLLHRGWIGLDGGTGEAHPTPWAGLAALATVALIALLATIARAAEAAFGAHGHVDGLPFDPLAPFGATPYAMAMRLAVGGAVVAGVIAATAGPGSGRLRLLFVGEAGAAVLLGMSLTGHAAALGGPVGAVVDAAHLLAIAAWLGALPAVIVLARTSGRGRAAFAAHARIALVAAPVVVLTGLANSPLVVDEPRELAASGYGSLLLTKAALVSLAVGIGAANFFLARGGSFQRLRALVVGEVAVGALAVVVGVVMVSIQPATDRPPAAVDPRLGVAHLYMDGGESTVHAIVDLPEPGVQSYSFAVSDPVTGAGREDVAGLTVTFVAPPEAGLIRTTELAEPTQQPWIWTLRGAYTPVVGTWHLEIVVHRGRLVADEMDTVFDVRQVVRTPPLPPPTTAGQILGLLAAPAAALPPGLLGWIVPVAVLGLAAGILALERRRANSAAAGGSERAVQVVRLIVVGGAVVLGVSLLARDVVAITNRAPEDWVEAENPLADDPDAVVAGERLYRANCASCHGATGAGNGPAVADLRRPPDDLAGIVPQRLDGELAWTIGAGVAGTQMPAFGTTLLDGERWELVSFLRSHWPFAGH